MWENEKVSVKILERILNVPFFADDFHFYVNFSLYLAIFILMIQNSVRENKNPYVNKFYFLCVKSLG